MFWLLLIAHAVVIIKGSIFLYRNRCRNSDKAIVANIMAIPVFFEVAQLCSALSLSEIWPYFTLFNSVLYYTILHGLEERRVGRGYCKTN